MRTAISRDFNQWRKDLRDFTAKNGYIVACPIKFYSLVDNKFLNPYAKTSLQSREKIRKFN
jgi:hypothetical protein